jgi:flavodoxin I
VGFTFTDGYHFESSRAQRGNQFAGLALDIENQAALSNERIEKWAQQLIKEFAGNK